MNFEHLTEEELQEFANAREIAEHASAHLRTCATCAEQLKIYRQLFSAIANQPPAEFDFNIAEAVMQKLPPRVAKETRVGISSVMVLITAGMCIGVAWWFADDISFLFKNIGWLIPVFTLVSLATAAIALGYDMFSRYNKKINFINSLK